MAQKVTQFRVGNGDMLLFRLDGGEAVLLDCNIRAAACDPNDTTPDVLKQLKARLPIDGEGRPYVHVMILSHPDQDHCRGFAEHFHTGPLSAYVKGSGKIIVREMWSSPMVFRRAERKAGFKLGDDAKAWAAEARRRVARYRGGQGQSHGDRIRILGEDENGKTDDLGPILTKVDGVITAINGYTVQRFAAQLLAPLPKGDDEEEENASKNNSSIVMRFDLGVGYDAKAAQILTGGDAGVLVWEKLWAKHKHAPDVLAYDLLLTPHHCSWRSLSWESWSDTRGAAKVSANAESALSQARSGARLVASSKTIEDDYDDPPCIGAKRRYKAIADGVRGTFICLADAGPEPLELEAKSGGFAPLAAAALAPGLAAAAPVGRTPTHHGGG